MTQYFSANNQDIKCMYKTPRITLDQWAAFQAVVEEGSFAGAAERLSKSQSSIRYAVAKLNVQLPAPVLQLQVRKAVLTDEGVTIKTRTALAAVRVRDDGQELVLDGAEPVVVEKE